MTAKVGSVMTQVRETEPLVLSHFPKAAQLKLGKLQSWLDPTHQSPPPPLSLCQRKWVSAQPDLGAGKRPPPTTGRAHQLFGKRYNPRDRGKAGSFSGIRRTPLHVSLFYSHSYSSSLELSKIRDREMGSWLGVKHLLCKHKGLGSNPRSQ